MKQKRNLDEALAQYADDVAGGKIQSSQQKHRLQATSATLGEEGEELMNTIGVLHNALRPMKVPASLAAKVRNQVRQVIAGVPSTPPAETAPKGVLSQLKSAAQAFMRRAGELVVNINLGEMIGVGALQGRQPAEVYAYSVVEALDKAAQRRKARILVDAQGRFYEVPQAVLKRCTLSGGKSRRTKR